MYSSTAVATILVPSDEQAAVVQLWMPEELLFEVQFAPAWPATTDTTWLSVAALPLTVSVPTVGRVVSFTATKLFGGVSFGSVKPQSAVVNVCVAPAATRALPLVPTGGDVVPVKTPVPVPAPPGPVTTTLSAPTGTPAGTVNVMVVSLTTVNELTVTPPTVIAVAPVKPVPVSVTVLPTSVLEGEALVTVGGAA